MKYSITKKLAGGFGLCVLMMVAIVGLNFSALQKLEKLYLKTLQLTEDMELATDAQHIGEDLYMVISNALVNRNMAKAERDWAAAKTENLAKLRKVAKAADSLEEMSKIKEAEQAFNSIVRIYEQEMRTLILKGAALSGPLSEIDARIDREIEHIDFALQFVAKSMSNDNQKAAREFHEVLSNTIRSGLSLSMIGVISAFFISVLTARRIVRPISELTRAAHEIEKGNYLVKLTYNSTDETGMLAVAFKNMSEQVNKRTAEQLGLNEHLLREINERQLAEEEVRMMNSVLEQRVVARTVELRNLSQHLQTVREEERAIISRDIHDDLGQLLTALKIDLLWVRSKLPEEQHRQLFEKTLEMEAHFDEAVRIVRRISTELRPAILDDLGLTEAIEWHTQELQKRSGITCEVHSNFDCGTLDSGRSTALFRVIQESLTNICRHADATRVEVELSEVNDELVVIITDNGKGITDQQISDPLSLGLIGMRERARYLGGEVTINRLPDGGTGVRIIIPLECSEQEQSNDKCTYCG